MYSSPDTIILIGSLLVKKRISIVCSTKSNLNIKRTFSLNCFANYLSKPRLFKTEGKTLKNADGEMYETKNQIMEKDHFFFHFSGLINLITCRVCPRYTHAETKQWLQRQIIRYLSRCFTI